MPAIVCSGEDELLIGLVHQGLRVLRPVLGERHVRRGREEMLLRPLHMDVGLGEASIGFELPDVRVRLAGVGADLAGVRFDLTPVGGDLSLIRVGLAPVGGQTARFGVRGSDVGACLAGVGRELPLVGVRFAGVGLLVTASPIVLRDSRSVSPTSASGSPAPVAFRPECGFVEGLEAHHAGDVADVEEASRRPE